MTRLFLTLSTLLCMALSISARSISGYVLADTDSTAVAGATCRLSAADKTLLNVMTNEQGYFQLYTDLKTELTLEVSAEGFNSTRIMIEKGGKSLELGAIFLNAGTELQGVTVTGSYTFDSRGRTIVFPSEHEVRASATTIGLLGKLPLPGLAANPINRSLTVDGGSPVILINGIPSTMDDVNSLKPKDIEKIEFTRLTPARYANSGHTGFLSITLKKRSDGGSVYMWGRSALNTAFMDGNFRGTYHQGPSEFVVSYNPSWRNYARVYDNDVTSYVAPDFRVDLETHDRNPFNYFTNPFRLRYNYAPSLGTLLAVTFNASRFSTHRRTKGYATDSYMGDYDYYYHQYSRDVQPSLDLYFHRDFNERNVLEAEVTGSLSINDYNRTNSFDYVSGESMSYPLDVSAKRRSLITEIDYTHVFSERTSLTAGLQNTLSHSRNDYATTDYRPVLTENNNYIYVQLAQQIGKIYVSASTGAKLFWTKNDAVKRHFLRNRTTAMASWRISPQWQVTGQFYYVPSIPSLASLTDYYQQSTPYLYTNGNPALKSSQSFTYQLSGSFNASKFSASLMGYINNVHNATFSDISYLGDGKFLSQSVNATRNRNYAAILSLRLADIYGFGCNVQFYLNHYQSAVEAWSTSLTSFSGSFSLWWNHGPFTISYWRKIPGKSLYGYSVSKEENGDMLQVQWQPNKHWTLGAGWSYMFERKGTQYPSWNYSAINPSVHERYIENNANMVVLTASFSTDFGTIFRSARRNLDNRDSGSSILQR